MKSATRAVHDRFPMMVCAWVSLETVSGEFPCRYDKNSALTRCALGVPTLTKPHQTRPVGSLRSYSIGFCSVEAKYKVSMPHSILFSRVTRENRGNSRGCPKANSHSRGSHSRGCSGANFEKTLKIISFLEENQFHFGTRNGKGRGAAPAAG